MNSFKKRSRFICLMLPFLMLFETALYPVAGFAWHTEEGDMHDGFALEDVSSAQAPANPEEGDLPPNNPCGDNENTEPIYFDTGEYQYNHTDISIPARGMPIEITRTYRSQREFNGRFGYGWFFSFYIQIKKLSDNNMLILDGATGRKIEFAYDDSDIYISPVGTYEELKNNLDGTYTLKKKNGSKYNFDINGNLASIIDRNGNQMTFSYDPAGKLPINGTSKYFVNQTEGLIAYDYMLTTITDTVGREINFSYNVDGRLETITDFAGRTWQYAYDDFDNLTSVTTPATNEYPSGLTTTFTYNADHNLETITDAKGQTYLTNHYDSEDRVDWQIYGTGTSYLSYDSENNKTTVTDWKGFVTEWTYSDNGNPSQKVDFTDGLRPTDPASFITIYEYNDDMQLIGTINPAGNGIKYTFDEGNSDPRAQGNILEIRRKPDMSQPDDDLVDIFTSFTYEPQFNLVKIITDPEGNVTTFTYDYELEPGDPNYGENGNLVRITYPEVAGQFPVTDFSYNQYGQLATVTDPNLNTASYEYYAATGYLWKIIQDPGGLNYITDFTYDDVGNLTSVTDARGNTTTFQYNELNQLTKQIASTPLSYQTKYFYDQNGNLTQIQRQSGDVMNPLQTTQYSYTVLDQLETIADPLGNTTSFTYDVNGNRASITDAENNVTTYQYDERDLIWKTTDDLSNITEYSYDLNGNLAVIKDARANETTYAYDNFDRLQTTTYADTSYVSYSYDDNSNLASRTTNDDPATTITYIYDALNRLDLKTYSDLTEVDYVYDLGSRLTSIQNPASSISYVYDDLNRIASTTQTLNATAYTLTYQYDQVGNRKNITYPSNYSLNYVYDQLNRPTQIKSGSSPLVNYSYDSLSRRTRRDIIANKTLRSDYHYDSANRLLSLGNKTIGKKDEPIQEIPMPMGRFFDNLKRALSVLPAFAAEALDIKSISSFNYTYDNVGNRLDKVTVRQEQVQETYGYDDIYQLTQVSGDQAHSYDYDEVGNREVVDATSYTANNLNQYTNVGGSTYSYDNNGNLENDGTNSYTYDFENRLVTAIGGQNSNYEYDGFGRRITKTVDGLTTYFVYDGDQVIEERDYNGSLAKRFTYGSGIDEPIRYTNHEAQTTTYYYFSDGLGSITELVNPNGAVVESYSYDVYGAPTQTSSVGNPYYFTGREYDNEAGLYYYRARMYNSTIGRFMQRDPYTGGPDDLRNFKKSHYYQDIPHVLIQQNNLMQFVNILSPLLYIYRTRILQSNLNPNLYFNRYLYCSNNPLNFIDPYGFEKMNELQQEYNQLLTELLGITFMSFVGLGTATVGLGASVGGGIGVVLVIGGFGLLGYEFYQAIDWAKRFGNWYLEMRREQERRALGGESKLW